MVRRRGEDEASPVSERAQADLEAAIEEFTSMAEEVNADLRRKSEELQALISEADRRIARLEEFGSDRSGEIAAASNTGVSPVRAKPPEPPGPSAGMDEIWKLSQSGMEVTEIAKKVRKTKGEVELILGLRKLG